MRASGKNKRIFEKLGSAIALLLITALLLTGCQPRPQADGVIHLTLWHGVNPPPNRDVLQQLVDRFNATHPTIQVESLYIGQGDQQPPKILAAVVGNATPDLLWYAPTLTGQLVELGAVRSLDDWITTTPRKDEIDPTLWDSTTWENQVWSVPFSTNNVGIFYRPSLFAEAGIDQVPTTWEEWHAIAHQLSRPDNPQRYGLILPLGKGEWTVFMWLPFLWSAGGTLVDANGAVNLVTPEAIAALNLWRDLIQDGSATLSAPERGYELDAWLAGTVAMQLTGPWTLRQLDASGVDYAVLPIPQAVQPATSTGGENLFVFKSTPEAEQAALTFVDYVLSEEFQTDWAIGTGYLPVNLRSRQSPQYLDFVAQHPAVQVFLDQAVYGRSRPIQPGYTRISESLGRAIEAVLLGKVDAKTALESAQHRLDLMGS